MPFPKKFAVAMVAIASFQLGCGTTSTATGRRLDAFFDDLHARGLFDGAVVVGDGQRISYERGFGFSDVDRLIAFTPATPTDGASLAKTFTAALLVTLQRDGVLELDQPAQHFLPELPYPNITLRHLLSHSSGIPVGDYDYFDKFLRPDQIRTTETLLTVLSAQKPPLSHRPGTSFRYSSFAYDLAALAAARATGKTYAALLHERVFRPLGSRQLLCDRHA